jgi:cytochrome c biogenesis protein
LTRGSADTGPRFSALTDQVRTALAARADRTPEPDAAAPSDRGRAPEKEIPTS